MRNRFLCLSLILLGFGLWVHRLDGQSLWWDEIFSYAITTLPPGDMLAGLVADRVHSLLYYLFLNGWAFFWGGSHFGAAISPLFGAF